jgi:hypothetical protein
VSFLNRDAPQGLWLTSFIVSPLLHCVSLLLLEGQGGSSVVKPAQLASPPPREVSYLLESSWGRTGPWTGSIRYPRQEGSAPEVCRLCVCTHGCQSCMGI